MEEKKIIEFWKEIIRVKLVKNWDVVLRKRKEFLCKNEGNKVMINKTQQTYNNKTAKIYRQVTRIRLT